MTKIIGHRGAAGVALENTLSSFKLAKELGVDAFEFDVRRTKDGKFVVAHDNVLARVSKSFAAIDNLTYDELCAIPLHNGERIPLLGDVLDIARETPVVVEIKIAGYTEEICKIVDQFPDASITYASFKKEVIAECRKLRPHIPALLAENYNPLTCINTAKAIHATGLDLNYKLLNPLTYWLCKRANLQIMVYTVNSGFAVWLIKKLYPSVWICTNHPQRFIPTSKDHK